MLVELAGGLPWDMFTVDLYCTARHTSFNAETLDHELNLLMSKVYHWFTCGICESGVNQPSSPETILSPVTNIWLESSLRGVYEATPT